MLFAAFVFSPFLFVVALAVILAVVAGVGAGHAAANRKQADIRRKEADGRLSGYFDKAGLGHIAKYFRCLEHGDQIGAEHERKNIVEIAMDGKEVDRIFDRASETWLRNRINDADARRLILDDVRQLASKDRGTMIGAIEAAEYQTLRGVKEQAVVPTGDGSTVTVPVVREVHHHHYGEKPADAPPAQAAA